MKEVQTKQPPTAKRKISTEGNHKNNRNKVSK